MQENKTDTESKHGVTDISIVLGEKEIGLGFAWGSAAAGSPPTRPPGADVPPGCAVFLSVLAKTWWQEPEEARRYHRDTQH